VEIMIGQWLRELVFGKIIGSNDGVFDNANVFVNGAIP